MVQEFVEKGGYRLYPSLLKFPTVAVSGTKAQICHTWENLGWGYCPNNIPQWNYRFKPAFALADKDGRIVKTFVDTDAEPSTWFKGAASSYELQVVLDGLAAGEYTWLVGIVDTQSDNKPGINLSVPASCVVDGWMKAGKLNIK